MIEISDTNRSDARGPQPAPDAGARRVFVFAGFVLDPANRLLLREGQQVTLPGRAFDLLVCLVSRPGELWTKEELLAQVWEGSFVEESNLTVAVSTLRRALGEAPQERKLIQTVARQGYRFVAEVSEEERAPRRPQTPPTPVEEPVVAQVVAHDPFAAEQTAAPTVPPAAVVPARSELRWPLLITYVFLLAGLAGGAWWLLAPRTPLRSLAVLPVSSDGRGPDEIARLGVTDALVQRLEGQLIVRPTSAVLRYSVPGAPDAVAAGREQSVDAVLAGTVSADGPQYRLRLRLIRTRDGLTLWQDSFRGASLAETESLAGAAVAHELHHLGTTAPPKAEPTPDTARAQANNPAWQLYQRGRYFWNLRTPDGLHRATGLFRQAIDADPNFAPAYSGLADSYALLASFSVEPGSQANADARSAALSAIQLDPKLAEPHASLGMILFFTDWNLTGAEREFAKSMELNPNYATAHHWYALDLAAMGRFPQALYEVRLAQKLDPLSLIIGTNVGWIEYLSRDNAAARQELGKVLEMDPNFVRAHTRLGMVELTGGSPTLAVAEFRKALAVDAHPDPYVEGLLGDALAASGDKSSAEKVLADLRTRGEGSYVPPISRALVLIGLGRKAEAMAELSRAADDHSTSMVYLRVDPTLDALRGEPGFAALAGRLK
ncbi:winged helix-turn-helix domain-containing protein [Granulicella cerasi]|uniref:Winged helix-turn-helix domain-containing protein n=1 Tax=Granulicella cerasi TaxID=741063 RepID=A0ABW1Z8H4_9BACT|nr:winged helix-turn-helix domain-containing protein [Granulicella cerasi]